MNVREDLIPDELLEDQTVIAEPQDRSFVVQHLISATYKSDGIEVRDRMRQPQPAKDISVDGYFALVKEALDHKYKQDSIIVENQPVFTEEYPPTDLTTEVISFMVRKRAPATFGGPPFQGKRQEFKSRIRSVNDDPNHPNFRLFTMGQQFENIVVFTCWAKTNKTVNARALWFEDFMTEYAWFLKWNGVTESFFFERGEDIALDLTGKGNIIHGRPLAFYVRTERLTHLSEPTMKRIIVRYGIDDENN